MIRSLRTVRAPALRASLSNSAIIHTRLRLHAVSNERVVNEDMLLMLTTNANDGLASFTLAP